MTTTDQTEGQPKPPTEECIHLVSGETLVFAPPGVRVRRRPMVALGRFRDGSVAVNFRKYAEHSPGVYAATQDGISLTVAELSEVVRRLRETFAAMPGLATEDQQRFAKARSL